MYAILFLICLTYAKDNKFKEWVSKNNKKYNAAEYLYRKQIFELNSKFVEKFNAYASFKLSTDGPYADLSNKEYQSLLGTRVLLKVDEPTEKEDLTIADSIDWREKGQVTPIKDQAQCGSCYSFSSLASIESQYLIDNNLKYSNYPDLSEQQVVDCSTKNNGCNGGSLVYVMDYVKKNGLMEEKDYPYIAKNGTCKYDTTKAEITIDKYQTVKQRSEEDLMEALNSHVVAAAIDASHVSFQLYSSGIYDEPKCKSLILDHGIAVVGYGSENGQDYYIVKNSWGTTWGESGYIRMSRNKNNQCGIASGAVYPIGAHKM